MWETHVMRLYKKTALIIYNFPEMYKSFPEMYKSGFSVLLNFAM